MVQVNPNMSYQDITVQGIAFSSPNAYSEGSVLKSNEAGALNKTLAENLRNNFASIVTGAKEAAAKANDISVDDVTTDHLDMEDLVTKWNEYVSGYEFGTRRGGTRLPTDPVEREALNIARDKVRAAIKAKGMTLSEVPAAQINSLAEQLIERNPAITEEAKRRVEAQRAIGLAELDLSNVGEDTDQAEGQAA